MRSYVYLLLQEYVTTAQASPISLAIGAARVWAVEYAWAQPAIRSRFGKLELELWAAGLS
jgi:hypothetical protein